MVIVFLIFRGIVILPQYLKLLSYVFIYLPHQMSVDSSVTVHLMF